MACFRPLDAWQLDSGAIVFAERGKVRRPLSLPCGRCIGCRLSRQRAWAIRCMHESSCHEVSSFVTLTYDDSHLVSPSLNYSDFQRFMYRLRRKLGPTRFFMCGEYGSLNWRPHFHALLFGRTFTDGVKCGKDIMSSSVLSSLWPFGFASFGNVTYQSAAYVAGYACKKVTGARAVEHYKRVDVATGEILQLRPEFGKMSLKPGIGYDWFRKYWKEVYLARDGVVLHGGRTVPAPRYYDKLLLDLESDLREYKDYERYVRSAKFIDDCTPDRLFSRELCAIANHNLKRRVL